MEESWNKRHQKKKKKEERDKDEALLIKLEGRWWRESKLVRREECKKKGLYIGKKWIHNQIICLNTYPIRSGRYWTTINGVRFGNNCNSHSWLSLIFPWPSFSSMYQTVVPGLTGGKKWGEDNKESWREMYALENTRNRWFSLLSFLWTLSWSEVIFQVLAAAWTFKNLRNPSFPRCHRSKMQTCGKVLDKCSMSNAGHKDSLLENRADLIRPMMRQNMSETIKQKSLV